MFYKLRCNSYKVQVMESSSFSKGQFVKTKTRPVTNKKCRSGNQQTVFDRMASSRMKGTNVPNSKFLASKLNEGNSVVLRRTKSSRAKNKNQRCPMQISLVLHPMSGRWFLHSDSCLKHKFHYEIPKDAIVLGAANLTDSHEAWIEEMYKMGLSNGTIAGVMTGYFNKKGSQGLFERTGIRSITHKHSNVMNLLSGIEPDMSQGDKTIYELNQ